MPPADCLGCTPKNVQLTIVSPKACWPARIWAHVQSCGPEMTWNFDPIAGCLIHAKISTLLTQGKSNSAANKLACCCRADAASTSSPAAALPAQSAAAMGSYVASTARSCQTHTVRADAAVQYPVVVASQTVAAPATAAPAGKEHALPSPAVAVAECLRPQEAYVTERGPANCCLSSCSIPESLVHRALLELQSQQDLQPVAGQVEHGLTVQDAAAGSSRYGNNSTQTCRTT